MKLAALVLATFALCASAFAGVAKKPEADPVIARVADRDVLLSEKDDLDGIIFGALLEQFAKNNRIAPTQDEIDAHNRKARELQAKHHQESLDARAAVLAQLKDKGLAVEARKALEDKLAMYDLFLKTDREMADYDAAHPKESRAMDDRNAGSIVQSWKVNRALYRKYGGRVIFQQFGPEPLDAYLQFLREQEKAGTFAILDKKFEADFWNYFTNDAMHMFYSGDSGATFIETPWWLMEESERR